MSFAEQDSPQELPLPSPTTFYAENPLSPTLNLKAVGQELAIQQRERVYRNTQPNFAAGVDKVRVVSKPKDRGETPKLEVQKI